MKKKGYIGWIVSRLVRGEREFSYKTLSMRKSDAIQNFLDDYAPNEEWRAVTSKPHLKARVHKVTEIKVAG